MTASSESFMTRFQVALEVLAEEHGLLDTPVVVAASTLSSQQAIGTPERQDFPLLSGKEWIVEATVGDARGHAFTDDPGSFEGTMADIFALKGDTSREAAFIIAAANAVTCLVGVVSDTVHCRDGEPSECGRRIAETIHTTYGDISLGLIGLNPAIAEAVIAEFGSDRITITDRQETTIGTSRSGVPINSAQSHTRVLIEDADLVLMTGTTMVNGTFDAIEAELTRTKTPLLVYGVSAAAACALLGYDRICPLAHPGLPA